jgi:hypothetical protein
MKDSRLLVLLIAVITLLHTAAANAGGVDMKDPRRALALEDDVRIDAQITQDEVFSGSPVNVTYQVQNLAGVPVAVADKICDTSYDADSQTITVSIGSEIPSGTIMPHLAIIKPGEKRTFSTGATVHIALPSGARSPFVAYPRYVQVKVNVLRDLTPFATLIDQQQKLATGGPAMSDQLFDTWIESNDAIFLNAIPVRWKANQRSLTDNSADMARPAPIRMGGTF